MPGAGELMGVEPQELGALALLDGLEAGQLESTARRLTSMDVPSGSTVITQGEEADAFALVVSGELVVTRADGDEIEELAVIGPGSIVGELALLGERARTATVTAGTDARLLTGGRDALLELLHLPVVADRLRDLVSLRLAEDAEPVPVTTADGTPLVLRPLRPDDREGLRAGIDAMSDESLYRRFFTGGRPGETVIQHLLDVDYVDHFAWVLAEPDQSRGLGIARYNRTAEDHDAAEAAFAVVDDQQGRGLGTLLLGALAVAAGEAGIERLRADVLSGNRPMRAVLDKAGATWETVEAGVVTTEIDVARARALLDEDTVSPLQRSVREVVTAAGLVLARRVA